MLGAGEGWARSILFHERTREEFQRFFARADTFTLGVCNGCQMMARLKDLIPGAAHWPVFLRNRSEQFEARLSQVEILRSPSVLLRGMEGSRLPIAVSHGEGRPRFADAAALQSCAAGGLIAIRYIDSHGAVARSYPANPNGAALGIAALTTQRRPRDDHDAAPGARLPHGAEFLAPARRRRGQRLDAAVPQRAGLGRLSLSARW